MASISFDKIQADAFRAGVTPRTEQSLKWFKKSLKELSIPRNKILRDPALRKANRPLPGRMYLYFYDPKYKKTLPYYDRFPLIFMVDGVKGGFTGLNLHYLDPKRRAIFFDKILDFTTNKKYNETTRLKLTYSLLSGGKRFKEFAPCYKRYLTSHIKSRISEVPPTEWEVALFMPTEKFVKNKTQTVWNKSRKLIES